MTKRKCKHQNTVTFDFSASTDEKYKIELCLDCKQAIITTSRTQEVSPEKLREAIEKCQQKSTS